MPITRAKASRLLNQSEMGLYDDSRANALRDLDARALASRVKRARTARDRARDLVQKQKLASRARTGSKRGASGADNQRSKDKAGLMSDILKRFEQQLKAVDRADRDAARAAAKSAKAATKKRVAPKATSKTPAAKKAGAKKAPARRPAADRAAAKQEPATAPTTSTRAGRKSAPRRKPSVPASDSNAPQRAADAPKRNRAAGKASRKRPITPEQALEQTRALLEAKHAHDAEARPWQDLPTGPAVSGEPGFQSDAAARRAKRLHAAEIRLPANQGSVSTRDRINQGKRDRRGDTD